jgi:regulatory subunit for Cdc7p protein kinase
MASRRQPLAHVPNAVNSPMRPVSAINGKRTRAQVGEQRDSIYGQPPVKRQLLDLPRDQDENVDPRRRNTVTVTVSALDKLEEPFGKRASHARPTAFEKKLASAREKKTTPNPRTDRSEKQHADNLESIRQWQKHYRRQFPQFVFYFESVPEDVRHKAARKIQSLGAREDKFFSKAVTHVITTRPIPPEHPNNGADHDGKTDSIQSQTQPSSVQTQDQRRGTSLLNANLQRRAQQSAATALQTADSRKLQPHGSDILSKARALGTKIWALEKLHRVLDTILDTDTGDHNGESRALGLTRPSTRATHNADLEQLLRHEKVNGPADRDMTVATQDMVLLRGCYIYVHDMDEKTKPVMVRDYPKPATKEHGKWPQFRLSAAGRCPFIEDPQHAKKLHQQERDAHNETAYRNTRAGTHLLPLPATLPECDATLRRSPRKLAQASKAEKVEPQRSLQPPPSKRQSSTETLPVFFNSAQANMRSVPRMVRGEPVASGVQQSNITSAIRSQAVSSAAISSTAPGLTRRVGETKEMSLLKRKVLASNPTLPTSHANDVRAAINADAPRPRAAKRKAQETLGVVHEGEENEGGRGGTRTHPCKRNKVVEKEAKPGYCENCRDKFDDFDEVSST